MRIYLYHTQDGRSIEFYDCFIISSLLYCRRPSQPINLLRDNDTESCEKNGGKAHLLSELRTKQINISTILHEWKSGLELVEQYSRYLRDTGQPDGYVCECFEQSFGKNCEYQLPYGITLDETLEWQLWMKEKHPQQVQNHGDIICYNTLSCNSGLLCLDWREICDGIQQCMYGYDENNCDLLELNRCDGNEYRCMNGMCIPDEYFLDGEIDCLDWSDEMKINDDTSCTYEIARFECDDRICRLHWWSCGDGQCIKDRFGFSLVRGYVDCGSGRDQYLICEIHYSHMQWTMKNGRCYEGNRKKYLESIMKNLTEDEQCEYLLKCSLLRIEAGCNGRLPQGCTLAQIQYPKGNIIGSYGSFIYDLEERNRLSNWILINGTIRCRDALITIMQKQIPNRIDRNANKLIEEIFCAEKTNTSTGVIVRPIAVHECYRVNDSTNICNESRTCMSITRINDGFYDCLNEMDEIPALHIEESCFQVQRHRFRCSINHTTCLSIMALGDLWNNCENNFDEQYWGTNRKISEMYCNNLNKDDCFELRQYIDQSWTSIDHETDHPQSRHLFRSFCDTFWNLDSKEDENLRECEQWWVCTDNQWRCRTGQCIARDWLDDGEWDCTDASDEIEEFQRRITLIEEKQPIVDPDNELEVLFSSCNRTHPFPCLPRQNKQELSCIGLDQIGNGKIECDGAIDERNTLEHCSGSIMLGYNFKCITTGKCIPFFLNCRTVNGGCNRTHADQWCFRRRYPSDCSELLDFICFNGTCVKGGRCNRSFDCSFGEDEYMCDYPSSKEERIVYYRDEKEYYLKQQIPQLPLLPINANTTQVNVDPILPSSMSNYINDRSSFLTSFKCNRGLGVLLFNGSIICFCPPQYSGDFCQYHNDRLLIVFHLDLSHSFIDMNKKDPTIVFKLLLIFLFHNQTLMTEEFHIRPATEHMPIITKKMTYFLYSRSSFFQQHRIDRYENRSNIITSQPYSIRIEIYQRNSQEEPIFIGLWEYPIYFDYLPVFQLCKVLRWSEQSSFDHRNPCSSNPCHENEECHQLINNPLKFVCLCKRNFTGENCSIEDQQCRNGYCSSKSLCKPNYRPLLRGNHFPYCICPFNRYGDRCSIEYDICPSNHCLNNGSCFPLPIPDRGTCLCTELFFGPQCQWRKAAIVLSLEINVEYEGAIIQYFDIDYISFDLILVHQQVHRILPSSIQYWRNQETPPAMVVAKFYNSSLITSSNLYLLSLHVNVLTIDGRAEVSQHNQCQHIDLFKIKNVSPIEYHHICINNSHLSCFRDEMYLCICNDNHTRVDCFNYDNTLDRCSSCLAGGRCLKGDQHLSTDCVCLCPRCYSGRYCQFNSKSFTFTLDQLFYTDLISTHKERTMQLIIIGSVLSFLIAFPNNLFSFVTFKRRSCLRTGIGNYLLYISVINQINLGFFTARLIHLSIIIAFPRSFLMIDNVLCKFLSFSLTSMTRVAYWFASFVALERFYTTIFLNGQWLKKPQIARRLMALTFVVIVLSGVHELVFVKLFVKNETGDGAMCVIEFPISHQSMWIIIHQIVSIVHFILPFLISICSTTGIICIVIKTKMNIRIGKKFADQETAMAADIELPKMSHGHETKGRTPLEARDHLNILRDVLNEHKEMIARPMITLVPSIFSLFSLPLFIASFSLACQNLETSRLRYLVMISYLISFISQMVTFFLYIYPSTFHWKEWQSTAIGRRIDAFRKQFASSNEHKTKH